MCVSASGCRPAEKVRFCRGPACSRSPEVLPAERPRPGAPRRCEPGRQPAVGPRRPSPSVCRARSSPTLLATCDRLGFPVLWGLLPASGLHTWRLVLCSPCSSSFHWSPVRVWLPGGPSHRIPPSVCLPDPFFRPGQQGFPGPPVSPLSAPITTKTLRPDSLLESLSNLSSLVSNFHFLLSIAFPEAAPHPDAASGFATMLDGTLLF